MRLNAGFSTDIGLKRQQNQDSGGAFPDLGLFIVADGMGGHRGGETASAMAVETVHKAIRVALETKKRDARTVLAEALRQANDAIYNHALSHPQLNGMGTTTTALLVTDGRALIGHVGDSRCYYIRPLSIWQLTRDHSLVQEKLRAGLITREQLRTDRMKNVITRSVGFEPEVHADVYEIEIQPGDVFLLCSDGLSGMAEDANLLEVLQKHVIDGHEPKKAADELVRLANANGGDDNVTALVLEVR